MDLLVAPVFVGQDNIPFKEAWHTVVGIREWDKIPNTPRGF